MKCIYCKNLTKLSSASYYLNFYYCGFHLLLFASLVVTAIERHGPYFTREPTHTIDFSNSTGTVLYCSTNGNPMPHIRWETKDGVVANEIPGLRHIRHDNSLVFPPFRAEDYRQDIHSNVYQCIASNSVGTIRSRYVHVRAVVQQHYIVEVYDEFVIDGNTGVIRCHIPGFMKDFVDVVSWIEDQNTLIQANDLPGDRFSVFPTGELYIRRVQQTDALKHFRCQVRHKLTGEAMVSTNSGRLFVNDPLNNSPPRITDSKPVVIAKEGNNVELGCAAQGFPIPTYTWHRNAQPIRQIAFNRVQQFDGSLRIRQVLISDSGIYRCNVNNSVGSEMIETRLIVTASLSAEIDPRLQRVDVGKSVQLNCTVSGTPIVSLEWLHNGQPIVTNSRIRLLSRDVLHISNVERRDKGMYQCLAQNDFDSAQAQSQIELGDDAPQFLSTFAEQTLQPGLPLSLKCVASGNPIPQVTWHVFDGIPIPDNSRYRTGDYVTREALLVSYVNISNTIPEDGGLYTCTAASDVSTIRHSARINIYGKPSVRSMLNMTAVAGERMTLMCPTGGYPIDTIIWERENVRLPYNHRQKVFPNGTLSVVDLERATDEGKYTCIARQTKESKSSHGSLYVQVLVRPIIEPFIFPKSLHQSQRYNLLCTVIKGDQPIQIEWQKDGKKLTNGYLQKVNLIHVTEYSLTLAFESVQPDHRGNYTCVASNAAGSSSHSANMIIHVPPRWRIEPIDTSVVKGKNAIIDCDTDAYPPPIISWSRAEGLLRESPSEFKSITSNSHLRPYENGSLAIHNAQKSDTGYYMCAATNGIGPGLSKVIKLTVNVAAHFENKFRAETVRKGLEARIKCDGIGDKPISISWLKDKMPFNPRDDSRYELIESIVADGIKSEIVIRNADRRDSALFSCITTNNYGRDDTNIQLIMQEPPDAPPGIRAMENDGRSARISWSAPYSGNSPITHYMIQYKVDSDKWTSRTPNVTISASETSVLVGGLRPVTNYQIRAFAINGLGKSEATEVIMLKTIEETPGGPPLHIKAVPFSSKSIKVSWKPPRKDLQYGTIRGYYVGYKIVDSGDPLEISSDFVYKTLEVKSDGFVEECTVSELKRSTKYKIIVQAYNSKGAGPSSEPVLVKTLELDPPPTPTLRVVSATANSIELSWIMNSDDSTPTTGFILHHKKESADWEELRLTDTKSHTHEWLRCGTRYQYYLIAFNSVGKSDPSSIVSAKTEGSPPVAPDRNSLLSVNTSSATIYLDAFHDGKCAINMFEVMYKLQKSHKWISLSNRVFNDKKHIVLSDLMPSTTYELKITAFNQAGSTEAEYKFTTSQTPSQEGGESPIVFGTKSPTSVPFYADVLVVVPSIISLVVVIILLSLVYVIFTRKPRHGSNVYANYSPDKLQPDNETVNMTQLDQSHVKKLAIHEESQIQNMVHYPTPYAMTKISENEERVPLNAMSGSSPLKSYNPEHDAIYATVKRTPRPPRSDVHIYQYPTNVQPDSGCESEASNAGHWRTSMVRFEHEPQPSVKLFAGPQTGLIYGRNQLRTSHNYQ